MIETLEEAIKIVNELGLEKAKEVLKWEEYFIDTSYERLCAVELFSEALKLRKCHQ